MCSSRSSAAVPVGVLVRVARELDELADRLRDSSAANLALAPGVESLADALRAAARGEHVDWRRVSR